MKTSEPGNQLCLVWSPRCTTDKESKPHCLKWHSSGGLDFTAFFFPSECYVKSYSTVFLFNVLVHEVSIKIFIPCWLCSCIWSTTKRRRQISFYFSLVFGACLCMSVVCVHMHKCEQVCKCECVKELEIVTDLKPKLLGFGSLKIMR